MHITIIRHAPLSYQDQVKLLEEHLQKVWADIRPTLNEEIVFLFKKGVNDILFLEECHGMQAIRKLQTEAIKWMAENRRPRPETLPPEQGTLIPNPHVRLYGPGAACNPNHAPNNWLTKPTHEDYTKVYERKKGENNVTGRKLAEVDKSITPVTKQQRGQSELNRTECHICGSSINKGTIRYSCSICQRIVGTDCQGGNAHCWMNDPELCENPICRKCNEEMTGQINKFRESMRVPIIIEYPSGMQKQKKES